jgi:LysR family hydrogen peroxide-inducible transcriptional activator
MQISRTPQMPLLLQENFTLRLVELLRQGEIDCAIMALPLPEAGLVIQPLYDEPFLVAVPNNHEWADRKQIPAQDLKQQTMLLLGAGHCFRDQVLEVCPELSRFSANSDGIQRTFEGSSLETIRHMVAAGIGITVLPITAVPAHPPADSLLRYIPLEPPTPDRRVVLAWRRSFPRLAAIEALAQAVYASPLRGVHMLEDEVAAHQV